MFHQAKKNDLSNVLDVTVVEAVGTADRPDERHEARDQLVPGRLLAAAGCGHQIAHRGLSGWTGRCSGWLAGNHGQKITSTAIRMHR